MDVAEHRDVLLAGAAVDVAPSVEEPGSPIKHKRWDQVSCVYMCIIHLHIVHVHCTCKRTPINNLLSYMYMYI